MCTLCSSGGQGIELLGNQKLQSTFLEAQFEGQALLGTQINVGGVSCGIHFHVLMS